MHPHADWRGMVWHASPLTRAIETAALLGETDPNISDALIETNWGEFEGLTLTEIDQQIENRNIRPATGLDLCPPGGESPRMVGARLTSWLASLEPDDRVCVTHKGVIRAALAVATGWDMEDPYPDAVHWHLPQAFRIHSGGGMQLERLNHPWEQSPNSNLSRIHARRH